MNRKGKVTRELIVEKAAGLFNSLGYHRASISDLMAATGLEKGGIYNHFESKDDLAVAAFEYAVNLYGKKLQQKVEEATEPIGKLTAFLDGFRTLVLEPPLPGGCPLLNCAIENDDGNPLLASKVRVAMEKLLSFAESLVKAAQNAEQLGKKHDPRQIATFIVSALEGGIMLSRLYNDTQRMDFVIENLKSYLRDLKD